MLLATRKKPRRPNDVTTIEQLPSDQNGNELIYKVVWL